MSRFGVMSWRPDGAEGVANRAGHHLIDGLDAGANGPQRRRPAFRRHDRVALVVDVDDARCRNLLSEGFDERQRMHARNVRDLAYGGLGALQAGEHLVLQGLLDSPKPVGALGMVRLALDVFQAFWMCDEKRRHKCALEGQRPAFASHVAVGMNDLCSLLRHAPQAFADQAAARHLEKAETTRVRRMTVMSAKMSQRTPQVD
jgi:hypothetical protein